MIMKNNKIKNFFKLKLIIISLILSFSTAYAIDSFSSNISSQTSSWVWSAWWIISLPDQGAWNGTIDYMNAGNNSTVIGNFFKWYYYDTLFWLFTLDWSPTEPENNVRIVWSTSACTTWYGYKLGGYAYSTFFGYTDFDYNENIFVYYCVDDGELHWYSYNKNIWFQNFEGIGFEIIPNVWTMSENSSTWVFVNDTTKINLPDFWDGNINSFVWGDSINLQDDKESIFYIIK